MLQDVEQITRRRITARARFHDARILEIGCGPGRVTAMYADATRMTIGVEPDPGEAIRAAQRVPDACFACASGMALPFRDTRFDVVLFTLSLHHHPDPADALNEAGRVLAPRGRVLVLEPEPDGEIQRLCNIFDNEDHLLERARSAVEQRGQGPLSRESFHTPWVFEDFDDVCRYAFGYYGCPSDAARREAMRAFLGPRAHDRPLRMTDRLRLDCLAG